MEVGTGTSQSTYTETQRRYPEMGSAWTTMQEPFCSYRIFTIVRIGIITTTKGTWALNLYKRIHDYGPVVSVAKKALGDHTLAGVLLRKPRSRSEHIKRLTTVNSRAAKASTEREDAWVWWLGLLNGCSRGQMLKECFHRSSHPILVLHVLCKLNCALFDLAFFSDKYITKSVSASKDMAVIHFLPQTFACTKHQ